jgi:transcriptional regulator with XRE-family HTH domain
MWRVTLRLNEWRQRRGYSFRALAKRAGVNYVTLSRIEAGRISPTVTMLEKLAKALDIDVRDFFPTRRARRAVNPRERRRA